MNPSHDIIVGIDLAAKPSNPTGWALLVGLTASARHLFTDEEILEEKHSKNPLKNWFRWRRTETSLDPALD